MPNDLVQRLDKTWSEIKQSLAAYLRRYQVSSEEVEDVISETYRRVRSRALLADIDDLEGYAMTVAVNLLTKRLKQGSRLVNFDDTEFLDESLASDIDAHHQLEHAYDRDRELPVVMYQFDKLSERAKSSILARLNGKSVDEIAEEMGRSRRTVQRDIKRGLGSISRALKRLRGERDDE